MKAFIVVLCAIVGMATSLTPSSPSMDGLMELATFTHELYLNSTCRELQLPHNMSNTQRSFFIDFTTCVCVCVFTAPTPSPCNQGLRGCCPYIVRPGPKGSVIQGFSGYRGNAAIIVDWGSPWNRDCNWRRNCTVTDTGFM